MAESRPGRVPRVLALAGTDPSGGAGLIADVKTITALGGYAMGVVTAVTVQNTTGVTGVHPVPVDTVLAQLDAVVDDVPVDAMKIGMLGRVDLVEAVTDWLRRRRQPRVVLDPVMVATTGAALSDDAANRALRALAPLCDLVTPNVPELGALADRPVARDLDEVADQARALVGTLGTSVLATTGDLVTTGRSTDDRVHGEDVLASCSSEPGVDVRSLPYLRTPTPHTHGTGCSLSSALATAVAGGGDWPDAYRRVRPWLDGALVGGLTLGVGHGSGPLDHNWFLHR